MKKSAEDKTLFSVVETTFPDGSILFQLEGEDWSSGFYTLEDLLVEILFHVGKIDRSTVFNLNYPKK